jgi:Domain of unknown function (DUF4263)
MRGKAQGPNPVKKEVGLETLPARVTLFPPLFHTGAPPMIQVRQVIDDLRTLVQDATRESELQEFLERYPWLLLNHHIDPDIVISQFPLGIDHRCDFVYFFGRSGGSFMKLVEIESPRLSVFTADDSFSASFNHAIQQLEDWHEWCERNRDHIQSLLEPLFDQGYITDLPTFHHVQLFLIAGTRLQISNARRRRRWEARVNRAPRNVELRTWDGFIEDLPVALFETIQATDVKCLRYGAQGYAEIRPSVRSRA